MEYLSYLSDQIKIFLADEARVRSFIILAIIMTASSLLFGFIGRIAFGKKSVLSQSVSSAIGILFIYAATVVIWSFGLDLKFLVSPLPFVTIDHETMHIFTIKQSDYVAVCGELMDMVFLAFVVNLINSWLPNGKNLFTWLIFRILSVALGMAAFALVWTFLIPLLPEGFVTWTPVILLGLLAIMLLTGALKGLFGAVLFTANPLVGFLYTFFFANAVGKMVSKAMLSTLLLGAAVYALNSFGVVAVAIGAAALVAYIPMMILLLILWFIVGKLL